MKFDSSRMSRSRRTTVGSPQRGCWIFVAMIMMMMMMTITVVVVQGSRDNPSTSLSTSKNWIKTIPSFIVKKESSNNNINAAEKQHQEDENDSFVNYSDSIAIQTHYSHSSLFQSLMKLRGGDEEEEDEIDYDEESDSDDEDNEDEDGNGNDLYQKVMDVTKTKIVPVVITYTKKAAITIQAASISFYHAMQRAISAGLEVVEDDEVEEDDEDDDEEEEEEEGDVYEVIAKKLIKFCTKSMKKIQRMVKAAITIPEDDGSSDDDDDEDEDDDGTVVENDGDAEENDNVAATESKEEEDSSDVTTNSISSLDVKETTDDVEPEETTTSNIAADFGSYLAENYSVEDKRGTGDKNDITILGGSLTDACKIAREQARMLVVFIPSEKPKSESWFGGVGGGKQTNANDQIAIESLLSSDVMKAANKKARKKGEAGLGSFAIWGSKTGSSEATSAIKRLKIKATSTTGEKRPILCVIYPAQDGSAKVLAQHHCNPPLKAESMASWMNALRKRHGKQYQSMQTIYKESQYAVERRDGYIDAVKSDTERKLKEAKEEAERKKKEVKEAARQAGIDARRQELQESLPEDLKSGDNVKKVKLTFADGRSGLRGFASDQPLSVVFNWVDAMFETERENVVLTTLNGKQTFSWNEEDNDKTLEDAGLKKMTAFRVSEATETNENESKD